MGMKETLDLIMKYPRIKSITVSQDDIGVMAIELYPTIQPITAQTLPGATDMPPDDVMMFASTPTFDEIVEKSNEPDRGP